MDGEPPYILWRLRAAVARRMRGELGLRWPRHMSELDDAWTPELEPEADCAQRGYASLLWLARRPERTIAVVAHGGLLHHTLNGHPLVVADDKTRRRFGNAELRACTMRWCEGASPSLELAAEEA